MQTKVFVEWNGTRGRVVVNDHDLSNVVTRLTVEMDAATRLPQVQLSLAPRQVQLRLCGAALDVFPPPPPTDEERALAAEAHFKALLAARYPRARA